MKKYKGVSWDVLSALALVFDLHPLAVEDVLEQGQIRSKADWFPSTSSSIYSITPFIHPRNILCVETGAIPIRIRRLRIPPAQHHLPRRIVTEVMRVLLPWKISSGRRTFDVLAYIPILVRLTPNP